MIKTINSCQLCGHERLSSYLDFGYSELSNALKEDSNQQEFGSSLEVLKCENSKCGCFQLKHLVSSDILFGGNYNYRSSEGLKKHFKEYASTTLSNLKLNENDLILGIGGNTGILEKEYLELGMLQVLNVEPAKNISEESRLNGIETFNGFLNKETSKQILEKYGKAKLITANNCLAHTDLNPIIEAIDILLTDNGCLVMENAYWLNTVENSDAFQIYSEHYKYLTIKSLSNFFNINGFDIFRVEYNQVQCGSFRAYIKRKENVLPIEDSVRFAIEKEESFGLYQLNTYKEFQNRLNFIKKDIQQILINLKKENKKIGLFGVAAKTTLMLKFFDIGQYIDFATDDSELKHNKYIPGQKIKIVNQKEFWANKPDCVIPIYNFFDIIIDKNRDKNVKWLRALPFLEIV